MSGHTDLQSKTRPYRPLYVGGLLVGWFQTNRPSPGGRSSRPMVARPVRYPAGETTVKLFYRNPVLSPSGASRFTKTYLDARASPRTADPQVFPVIPCHPCDSSLRDFSPRDGRDPAR